MALTFYYMSGSQYSWRVWLALEHTGIPYVLERLSYDAGDLNRADFVSLNPRRKVPVIQDGEFSLYESAAIVEYIEDCSPAGPQLFSADIRMRARQRRMIREVDQYFAAALDRLVRLVLLTRRKDWSELEIEEARTRLKNELRHWEGSLCAEYLGGVLSAVDFSLFPLVALLRRMNDRRPGLWSEDIVGPKFAAWLDRMERLDVVQKTWPPHWRSA